MQNVTPFPTKIEVVTLAAPIEVVPKVVLAAISSGSEVDCWSDAGWQPYLLAWPSTDTGADGQRCQQ